MDNDGHDAPNDREYGDFRNHLVTQSYTQGEAAGDRIAGSADVADADVDAADPDGDADGDMVRNALADARRIARTTIGHPGGGRLRRADRDGARRTRQQNLRGRRAGAGDQPPAATTRNSGGYSGPGADPRSDPQRIGAILDGYVADRGWDRPLAQARVFADWPALVGVEVAAHCAPQSLTDGVLRIGAESTAWATQLRLLAATLLARLVAELGPDVVSSLHISGPVGPSWNKGRWSVRGRGPRDTYG